MRATLLLLLTTILAALLLSFVIWRPLLTTNRPTTPPLTADQRRYGPDVTAEALAPIRTMLPAPLGLHGPLQDVIDSLRDRGRSIFVNWRALTRAGIGGDVIVHADVSGLRFDHALDKILASADGGSKQLSFLLDEGVITISTIDDLSADTMTRVYDLRDFARPPKPTTRTNPVFGSAPDAATPSTQPLLALERHILSNIDPASWRGNGGSVGSLRFLGWNLIVSQTRANHHDITMLLERLRWQKDLRAFRDRTLTLVGASVVLALSARFAFLWRQRILRSREGLCQGCGYDLRASRDRCPECGMPMIAAAS